MKIVTQNVNLGCPVYRIFVGCCDIPHLDGYHPPTHISFFLHKCIYGFVMGFLDVFLFDFLSIMLPEIISRMMWQL